MWIPSDHHRLALNGAHAIFVAYEDYERRFQAITRRAKGRFEARDWHGMQHDAVERLELYGQVISRIVAETRERLDLSVKDKKLWAAMNIHFMGLGGVLRDAFLKAHGELLTARYWNQTQARHRAGELLDIIPYARQHRLAANHEGS